MYTYEPIDDSVPDSEEARVMKNAGLGSDSTIITAPSGRKYIRRTNITDWALETYRHRYGDTVTREDIFYFVYGFLHSPEYRERYANDLKRSLPRIPYLKDPADFWAFAEAGRKLAHLHLNYETIEPHPDVRIEITGDPDDPETYRIQKMRFAGKRGKEDRTTIIYNEPITIAGIPPRAYEYTIAGRSPIEWVMERYQITVDEKAASSTIRTSG